MAAQIIGIDRIDDRLIGKGRVGPVTSALTEEFRQRVKENPPED